MDTKLIELTNKINDLVNEADDVTISRERRAEIAKELRKLLDERAAIQNGQRQEFVTTKKVSVAFSAVQRALSLQKKLKF